MSAIKKRGAIDDTIFIDVTTCHILSGRKVRAGYKPIEADNSLQEYARS